jgi:hypothetical protein
MEIYILIHQLRKSSSPNNLIYYLASSHNDLPHRETGHIVYLYGRNTSVTVVSDIW